MQMDLTLNSVIQLKQSQQSYSDWALDNERFNQAMNLAKGTCPALESQQKIAWKDVSKSTKSMYINISSNAVRTVIDYIVPARSS